MSKLSRKGSGIDFAGLDEPEPASAPVPVVQRPRTGVGAISASLALGRGIQDENDELKARLAEFEGREFLIQVEPSRIRASVWANRHEAAFSTQEFAALREEIASAGGNVQPIKLRPLKDDPDFDYEIIFGHRRHRACQELGLPVTALVEALNDQQLFVEMERENRGRENLSPWEQGMHYRRALDMGLFPSARQLAVGIGAPHSGVTMALQLAALPAEVVQAFGDPLALQYRWAAPLSDALSKDRDGVLARAKRIAEAGAGLSPKHVLSQLLQEDAPLVAQTVRLQKADGKAAGTVVRDEKGVLTIRLKPGILSREEQEQLTTFVEKLLKR